MSPKEIVEKQTIIVIPEDESELAEISTFNRKWINHMVELAENDLAEEVEASIDGAREFQFDRSLLRMPYYRRPREWTDEQRAVVRDRLAAVRAANLAEKEAAAPKKGKKAAPAAEPKKTVVTTKVLKTTKPAPKVAAKPVTKKKAPEPEPEDEDVEDEFDEDEIDDDEEEEEVVVKQPKKVIKHAKK